VIFKARAPAVKVKCARAQKKSPIICLNPESGLHQAVARAVRRALIQRSAMAACPPICRLAVEQRFW
jgi:hypothetical protein